MDTSATAALAALYLNRYSSRMKQIGSASLVSIVFIATALWAEQNWAGEYVDKNFLNGKAVFQMSIEQSGETIQVSFDAVYSDGHGAAPEGQGPAKIRGKDTLEFRFEDSFKNSGTGTITRAGDEVVVSMKTTRVADSRCLAFYGQNMRLKRIGKR
jgi:hypothetical protein